MLPSFTYSHLILPSFTEFLRRKRGFFAWGNDPQARRGGGRAVSSDYQVLPSFTWFLPSFTEFLPSSTQYYLVLFGFQDAEDDFEDGVMTHPSGEVGVALYRIFP